MPVLFSQVSPLLLLAFGVQRFALVSCGRIKKRVWFDSYRNMWRIEWVA